MQIIYPNDTMIPIDITKVHYDTAPDQLTASRDTSHEVQAI